MRDLAISLLVACVGGIMILAFKEQSGINDWWTGWITGMFTGWLVWRFKP